MSVCLLKSKMIDWYGALEMGDGSYAMGGLGFIWNEKGDGWGVG